MKYIRKRRYTDYKYGSGEEDPLTGLANLLDIGLVYIVGLFLLLINTFNVMDFLSEDTEMTIMKKDKKDRWEIITKKGKEVKVEKITDAKVGGKEGKRLGTAYKLKNGKVIYVPDKK